MTDQREQRSLISSDQRELVTTTEHQIQYERILVQPRYCPPRTGKSYQRVASYHELPSIVASATESEILAVDFETRGNDYSLQGAQPDGSVGLEIVGVGLAWNSGSAYLPWTELYPKAREQVRSLLLSHPGLIAHNVYFDGGVILTQFGQHAQWLCCTLAAYKRCSNEGWVGQRHGLKDAMVEILQWESANDTDLDIWLCRNGYYKGNKRKTSNPKELEQFYREGSLSPEKGEMWRAPKEILGKYCVLDAEACYLLYTEFLAPVLERFPALKEYLTGDFMYLILRHIEQKCHGILMDRQGLQQRKEILEKELERLSSAFFGDPKVAVGVRAIEAGMLIDLQEKEPPKFKKLPERPPEPAKFKKDGAISKNWLRWVENEPKYSTPIVSLVWENWRERWEKASRGEDPSYRFNLNSGQQLAALLYDHLDFPIVDSLRTDAGAPGTSIKALKKMGEIGGWLVDKAWVTKELSYIQDYLDRTEHRPTLHPSFRLPGPLTGRLSSNQPNLQQVPKTKAVMSLFRARPGHVLVDLDFSALEPVVATEFSQDPNMLQIYGEGASPNDIYLFVAAHIPGMGEQIRATGYDPYNPTKETLAAAKKECKAIRSIAKTVVLACQYGAGVGKIMETLENDNIFLEEEEVRAVWETYWDLFSGVKDFSRKLEQQWKLNGGYILNGLGLPMCVDQGYRKDILNRFIQSTGHDILVKYVRIYTEELDRREIPWYPHVLDWHDASAVEVPEAFLDQAIEVYKWGLEELNRQLGGTIRLKGTPSYGPSMADIKEPEE